MLDEVGLRDKLLQVGDVNEQGSPAWWANKSPLRSFAVGEGIGQTARELGIKTVAHDTSDFFLWTVITRSRKGEANVFESREGVVGENAAFGNGFYTIKNSEQGAHGTGYAIRFTMATHAREGTDFQVVSDDVVLVLNRAAIRVIPDSLSVGSLLDYFRLVKEGERGNQGLLDKVGRQVDRKYRGTSKLPKKEVEEILNLLKEENDYSLWRKWFEMKVSLRYPRSIGVVDD